MINGIITTINMLDDLRLQTDRIRRKLLDVLKEDDINEIKDVVRKIIYGIQIGEKIDD